MDLALALLLFPFWMCFLTFGFTVMFHGGIPKS